MKKKMAGAMAALLMFAACQMPAFAAEVPEGGTDYGSFYDETGVMNTEVLQELGEVTLPSVGGAYGVDLRVDVLDYADGKETMEEMAARIYEEYGYGYPDTLDGISLTLLLGTDGDSYTLPEGNWIVYGAGEDQQLMETIAASVSEQVAPYLTEGAWDGDLASDQATLEQAVSAVSDAVQQACEDNGIQKAGALLNYVTDVAGLLSDEQLQTLEQKAQEVSEQYNCGVYAVTVDDYQNYDDSGVFDTAVAVYHGCNLGEGSDRDGILLLLSMADRDYAMFVYGPFANEAFNSYGQEQLEQVFLDDFADNDWYNGFTDYIENCASYMQQAVDGMPVSEPGPSLLGSLGLAFGIGCVIALIVCVIMCFMMKSVAPGTSARAYVTPEGLHLTGQRDQFTHRTQTRRKIEKDPPSGGGGTSHSGGGGSGRSGKF
ncbi:TPM domain-containing protein [Oscillospiraceae bacterium NTUH-002-81]|nr:TPM domain-containing protein [Oscillospiraceae bacterium NTUH-002-81]